MDEELTYKILAGVEVWTVQSGSKFQYGCQPWAAVAFPFRLKEGNGYASEDRREVADRWSRWEGTKEVSDGMQKTTGTPPGGG